MKIRSFAKINLSLDVIGKRDDGYHNLRMIMQSIGLYDTLNFNRRENDIKLYCSNANIPCDQRNIVYKVLNEIKKDCSVPWGMEVDISKSIPAAAGLGGGSADGAAAIICANTLWNLNLSYEQMVSLGKRVGADIPFCIKGGTSLAEGIGDILTPLNPISGLFVVLAKPPISVSTREVYQNLKLDEISSRPDTDRLVTEVNSGNIRYIADNMVNVLEAVTIKKYPVIDEIKRIMIEFGALGSLMSGSGPAVFGLFDSKEMAEKCYNRLRDYIKEVYMVETRSYGQEIENG